MKVLLIQDVKSLGKAGEVKEVKPGYGQNFLIKKGFAKPATPEIITEHKMELKRKAEEEATEIARLNELTQKLDKLGIVITKKIGKNGHLFGAVTKDEIAHALQEQYNIEIDKKHITEKTAIKTVGEHNVDLKLGHGIHATLHIEIQGE